MAKLKAPLLSLGASQQLGKALVYFGWKGLDCVREYVIPANPKTSAQTTHRALLTAAVALIHSVQALAAQPFVAADATAYALLGSTYATPRTWFNQIVKQIIDQQVASLKGAIFRELLTSPGVENCAVSGYFTKQGANSITACRVYYGTSKTALNQYMTADVAGAMISKNVTGLTANVKYYFQFRPTAHADFVGVRSGIVYGTPRAS